MDFVVFNDIARLATLVTVAADAPLAALTIKGTPFIPIDCTIANAEPAWTVPILAE